MSGLLESIILGGAKGYAQGTVDNIEQQKKADAEKEKLANEVAVKEASAQKMLGIELGMRDDYAQRVAERTQKKDIADAATIRSAAEQALASKSMGGLLAGAGTGAKVTAEDLQALKDNPDALKRYRLEAKGLLNNSRQDMAEEEATQAQNIGRFDIATKKEAVATGERADARLEQTAKQAQMNFDKTFAMQSAQFAKADKAADIKGKEDAVKSVVETVKSIKGELTDLLAQKNDPMTDKSAVPAIDAQIKGLRDSLSNANKWMIEKAGITPDAKPVVPISDAAKAIIAAQDAGKNVKQTSAKASTEDNKPNGVATSPSFSFASSPDSSMQHSGQQGNVGSIKQYPQAEIDATLSNAREIVKKYGLNSRPNAIGQVPESEKLVLQKAALFGADFLPSRLERMLQW